jgi:hypothetical protein
LFRELNLVPKLALFASIPFDVIIPIPAEINVVAKVMTANCIAIVREPSAVPEANIGAKEEPTGGIITIRATTTAAINADLIALPIYTPTSKS